MAGIGIVVNPQAGGVRRDPELPLRLQRLLGSRGELIVARGADEIAEAMEAFKKQAVDVLGVVGGDGSNLYTLTAATQAFNGDLPPLALLPGGSVNTVFRSLGLRGTPEGLLRRLLRHEGPVLDTVAVDTMRVNGYVGFVFGAALVGKFYQGFYGGKDKGMVGALRMIAKSTMAAATGGAYARVLFSPVRASIRVDGQEIPPRDYTLILASTIRSHLGIKVTYRAKERPGHFHLVGSGGTNLELARQFPKTFFGLPLSGKNHLDVVAREAELRFDAPGPYIIDGDLYEGDHVTIQSGPRLEVVAV